MKNIQRQISQLIVFIFFLSTLFLVGCVNSYNISKRSPFNNYVGRTFELHRPALLVRTASVIWANSEDGVPSVLFTDYGLIDAGGTNKWHGNIYAVLPAGHRVTIDSVRDEAWGDSGQITVYGRTTIPLKTNNVSFAYSWGYGSYLEKAPWEPINIPQKETKQ